MKRLFIILFVISALCMPVSAMDFTAPEAPPKAQQVMPDEAESFGEGLWYIIRSAIDLIQPSITQALGLCVSMIAISIISGTLHIFWRYRACNSSCRNCSDGTCIIQTC